MHPRKRQAPELTHHDLLDCHLDSLYALICLTPLHPHVCNTFDCQSEGYMDCPAELL